MDKDLKNKKWTIIMRRREYKTFNIIMIYKTEYKFQ